MVKTTYILEGVDTSLPGDDAIRYRDFTTSPKAAEEFAQIPRIQFSDSGHGVIFRARIHEGGKRGKKTDTLGGYVQAQLAIVKTRKSSTGERAIAYLEQQVAHVQEYRMARKSATDSIAARYVDDVQVLQRLGDEAAAQFGITREQIRETYLQPDDIAMEQAHPTLGSYQKFIHFKKDGSFAGQVRGSKRWEVWR